MLEQKNTKRKKSEYANNKEYFTNLYKKIGVNCYSLSDGVSILKECARIMVNKNIQKGATNV